MATDFVWLARMPNFLEMIAGIQRQATLPSPQLQPQIVPAQCTTVSYPSPLLGPTDSPHQASHVLPPQTVRPPLPLMQQMTAPCTPGVGRPPQLVHPGGKVGLGQPPQLPQTYQQVFGQRDRLSTQQPHWTILGYVILGHVIRIQNLMKNSVKYKTKMLPTDKLKKKPVNC